MSIGISDTEFAMLIDLWENRLLVFRLSYEFWFFILLSILRFPNKWLITKHIDQHSHSFFIFQSQIVRFNKLADLVVWVRLC